MPTATAIQGVTLTYNNDGTYTISGTNTSSSWVTFRINQSSQIGTDNLQNYENGTYTLDKGTDNTNVQATLMQNNTWTQYISTGTAERIKSQAITNATNTFIYIGIKGNASFSTPITIKPMFLKGSYTTETIGDFEQYYNIELCKIGNYQDYLYKTSGKNLLDESTLRQGSYNNTNETTRIYFNSNYYLEPGTYTLISNLNLSSFRFAINVASTQFPNNNIDIYNSNWLTSYTYKTFTLTTGGYFGLGISKSNGTDNITPSDISNYKFMLYKGNYDTSLPYEPYGSDKWYKKENIGKVVLNGSENWIKSNTRFHTTIPSANGNYVVGALCREYIEVSTHDIHANTNYSFIVCNSGWGIDHCRISFNNSDYASIDSWKNALATNNIVVYYQLTNELGGANDIEITNTTLIEQLDNLEKMKSYNGTTNISSNGNLPMVLGVSALKGE